MRIFDRRKLLVLGATSWVPACSPTQPTSSGAGGSGRGGAGGTTATNGSHAATTSGPGVTTTTATNATTGSGSSTTASTTTGGMTCTTGANSHRLAFASYPQLMTAGGSVGFQGAGYSDPSCQQPDIIVVAKGGGQFVAYSASCSHNCCVVQKSGSSFRCPCHGATFSLTTGACTNGIAPAGLVPLKVCADATGVVVTW